MIHQLLFEHYCVVDGKRVNPTDCTIEVDGCKVTCKGLIPHPDGDYTSVVLWDGGEDRRYWCDENEGEWVGLWVPHSFYVTPYYKPPQAAKKRLFSWLRAK